MFVCLIHRQAMQSIGGEQPKREATGGEASVARGRLGHDALDATRATPIVPARSGEAARTGSAGRK
jgi:hypothetical protein